MQNLLTRAVRAHRGNAVAATAVIAILGMAMGLNTAVFRLVNELWVQSVPYDRADRLAVLFASRKTTERGSPSMAELETWRNAAPDEIEVMAAMAPNRSTALSVNGVVAPVGARFADTDLFTLLSEIAVAGRLFTGRDRLPNAIEPILITERLWRGRFGASPALSSQRVELDGVSVLVIGVVSDRIRRVQGSDVFRAMPYDHGAAATQFNLTVVAALRPGATPSSATTALNRKDGESKGAKANVLGLRDYLVGAPARRTLGLFAAGAACALLVACLNVSNLLATIVVRRQREWVVRIALGASLTQIAWEWTAEWLVVFAAGGVVGTAISGMVLTLLQAALPDLPSVTLARDWQYVAFSAAATLLCGLAVGLLPLWRLRRLYDHGAAASLLQRESYPAPIGAMSLLLATQMAFACVIAVAAGSLMQSYSRLVRVDLGFVPAGVVAMNVTTRTGAPLMGAASLPIEQAALEELAGRPGVLAVGVTDQVPLGGSLARYSARTMSSQQQVVAYRRVSPGYFETIRATLLAGRAFDDGDRAGAPEVAIVNQTAARLLWPSESPLGKLVYLASSMPIAVVGVVADMRGVAMDQQATPEVFRPRAQDPAGGASFVIRTDNVAAFASGVRQRPPEGLDVATVRTLDELVMASVRAPRVRMRLFAAFGILIAVVVLVGHCALSLRAMTLRNREIGVRVAMGASRAQMTALLVWTTTRAALIGTVAGGLLALWTNQMLKGMLFETSTSDPAVLALGIGVLLAGGGLTTLAVARRAAAQDPAVLLRRYDEL